MTAYKDAIDAYLDNYTILRFLGTIRLLFLWLFDHHYKIFKYVIEAIIQPQYNEQINRILLITKSSL